MAELILPLCRTLFLPAGCPSLGCVEKVSGDLREVCCGSTGGEAYCMGEADILIEYTAPLGPSGLFAPQKGRPGTWQALLSFPFQLCGEGNLPHDSAHRVELGPLCWSMVASRAIELDTEVRISYEQEDEEAVAAESDLEEADLIYRESREQEHKRKDDWQMVTINDEEKRQRLPVEIVDLTGEAETQEIEKAVARALAEQADSEAEATAGSEEAADPTPVRTAPDFAPDLPLPVPEEVTEPEEQPAPNDRQPERERLDDTGGKREESAEHEYGQKTEQASEPYHDEEREAEPPQSPSEPEPPLMEEPSCPLLEKAAPQPPAPAAAAVAELPVPAVIVGSEEEEIVREETTEPQPHPKRRFQGMPGLHVEAHNNDIDVTAFHISIKL